MLNFNKKDLIARKLTAVQMNGIFSISRNYNTQIASTELMLNNDPIAYIIPFSEFLKFVHRELDTRGSKQTFLMLDSYHKELIEREALALIYQLDYIDKTLRNNPNAELDMNFSGLDYGEVGKPRTNKLYLLYENFIRNCICAQIKFVELARKKMSKHIPFIVPDMGTFKYLENISDIQPDLSVDTDYYKNLIYSLEGLSFKREFPFSSTLKFANLNKTNLFDLIRCVDGDAQWKKSIYNPKTIYGANKPKELLTPEELEELKALDKETQQFREDLKTLSNYLPEINNDDNERTSRLVRFKTYYPELSYETIVNNVKQGLSIQKNYSSDKSLESGEEVSEAKNETENSTKSITMDLIIKQHLSKIQEETSHLNNDILEIDAWVDILQRVLEVSRELSNMSDLEVGSLDYKNPFFFFVKYEVTQEQQSDANYADAYTENTHNATDLEDSDPSTSEDDSSNEEDNITTVMNELSNLIATNRHKKDTVYLVNLVVD